MLERLHWLACRLAPIRPALLGLAAVSLTTAGVVLLAFAGDAGDVILMPAILLLLWAIAGLIFVDVFAHAPPPPASRDSAWPEHWLDRLWLGLRWMLALGFVALSLTVADLSLHIADAWLRELGR